jgi:hypothetical protein
MESQLDLWFMPEWGDVYARFSPDGLSELTEDETATSTRMIAEVTAGLRTREEARKVIGLDETMNPTDTLIGSISRIEYPVALQFAHSTPTADPAADAAALAEDDNPDDPPPAPRAQLSRIVRRGVTLTAEQRGTLWTHFETRANKEATTYERTARLLFVTEQDGISRLFAQATDGRALPTDPILRGILQQVAQEYAPGGAYHQAWLDRYRGLVSQTFTAAGGEFAKTLGIDFNLQSPVFQAAIRARASKLAETVTETTYTQIKAAIEAGHAAGMTTADIGTLINETVFAGQAPQRAATIARTESAGALNQGEYLTAQDAGVMRSKEWLSMLLPTTRETHADLDGTRIDIDQAFDNGLQYPGDPSGEPGEIINCLCTLLYYDEAAS